jgi:iron complex transport system ATP-binding protein
MTALRVEDLCYRVADRLLLQDIDLTIRLGTMVGLIGPNGAGKSMLLKNVYRVLKPSCGCIFLNGDIIGNLSNKEVARRMAVVSQDDVAVNFDFKVLDIVMLGRFDRKGLLEFNSRIDHEAAHEALKQVDMESYQDRNFASLSGGEKQRVMIARAVCQQSGVIIMDEPTNSLDIKHQLGIIKRIKQLNVTSLIAIHDINIATAFCDELVVLKDGKHRLGGKPEDIVTREMIREIFDVDAHITFHLTTGRKVVVFA